MLLAVLVGGCGPNEPVRIGFIGGLSDRYSDVGQAGYNGVVLAVEQINRSGGINGRLVELIAKDDAQGKDATIAAANELVNAKVDAVIGPFSSYVAALITPVFDKAGVVIVSPTITGMDFHGKDDHLIRINRTTRDNARDYSQMLVSRGQKRIAVAYDTRNQAFTESWLNEFRAAMKNSGGEVVAAVSYYSQPDADYSGTVREMVASRPDGLLFISTAIDVARLAQQARKQAPNLQISASEWAATEQLLDLGGKVVDGLLIALNYNRQDESTRYVEFREAYYKRFQRNPGYSSVSAHDAATVVLSALSKRQSGETAKQAILKYGPYQGLQQEIAFDANGDTERIVFFNEIRNGQFRLVK